jgi:surface polysaccharide O-acyltransferase-like enzyme
MCGIANTELSILWFMYCLAGMYLLTPILSRWLSFASVKEIEFYLLLWLVTLCIPFVKIFFPVNESDTSWLYYFHGYVGYYVLGYYLQNYFGKNANISIGRKTMFFLAFVAISIVLPIVLFVLNVEVDFYSVFWYLSITIALWCIVWWIIVKRMMQNVPNLPNWVVELSKLSFGIYLVHILVMRNILWKTTWMQEMNGIVQIVVCTILTFTISALISWGISKIKYVRTIIGY